MSGMPVFARTRVAARTMFDYLEEGHNRDEFLDDFPTGSRQQAQAVLGLFRHTLPEQPYESAA